MADWKQITARIRRARTAKDPATQLSNLFAKTRDAMVAFELARYFESVGNNDDAGKWYLSAAERFRRSDWKTKAQESATRLGATVAADMPEMPAKAASAADTAKSTTDGTVESEAESDAPAQLEEESVEPAVPISVAPAANTTVSRRNPRGRRGGRDSQRGRRTSQPIPSTSASASTGNSASSAREVPARSAPPARRSTAEETPAPSTPSFFEEQAASEPSLSGLRGRSGHPGLSSRLSQMEMNFRRLLASAPLNVEDASQAPAGPGVWVLADSDQSTYYYVESCQTLRVAIAHILRGTSRSGTTIKPQLAEHLGIAETRVSKYLSDHCAVRWLQMDEGAAHFAHFLISVLHPILNE